MERVRLGFVGVGSMGQCAHLVNYSTLPGCEVVALAELREGLGRRVAARYGVPGIFRDHRDMLAHAQLDAIVAIQPFQKHGQLIPELAQSGLPILIEKPIARSVESAARVLQAARAGGSRLYIAYHKRSDPATLRLKQQMTDWQASGRVGKLQYIRVTMPPGDWVAGGFNGLLTSDEPYPQTPNDPPAPEFDQETETRYTAFVNYYIHQVNLLRFLYGGDYRVTHVDPSGRVIVTQSAAGVPGVLEAGIYATTLGWQEAALVAFERGWLRLELPAPLVVHQAGRLTCYEDPGNGVEPRTETPTLPPVHAMRQQAIHFLQAVRGEPTVLCEPEEALADLRIAAEVITYQNRI